MQQRYADGRFTLRGRGALAGAGTGLALYCQEANHLMIERDPEKMEIEALGAAVKVDGRRVLEIGAGNGRLTWRYAQRAAQVTAIDPDSGSIEEATRDCPPELRDRVSFHDVGIEGYRPQSDRNPFEVVLLSWSL